MNKLRADKIWGIIAIIQAQLFKLQPKNHPACFSTKSPSN